LRVSISISFRQWIIRILLLFPHLFLILLTVLPAVQVALGLDFHMLLDSIHFHPTLYVGSAQLSHELASKTPRVETHPTFLKETHRASVHAGHVQHVAEGRHGPPF
jgi:uncharacterized membrane protein